MRVSLLLTAVLGVSGGSPGNSNRRHNDGVCQKYTLTSVHRPTRVVDIFIFPKLPRHIANTDGEIYDVNFVMEYCSRIWPNEDPEISMFPMPPGCMRIFRHNPLASPSPENSMKVLNEEGNLLHVKWVPETDIPDMDKSRLMETEFAVCGKVFSKIYLPKSTIIVGESCNPTYKGTCSIMGSIHSSSHCARKIFQSVEFGQPRGFHRTLNSSVDAVGEHGVIGVQWLPRQIFSEPDELARKLKGKAISASLDVNIENPSAVSPPQIVLTSQFPIPVHSRVNPPLTDASETHFRLKVPQTIWMAVPGTCATESMNLGDSIRLPKEAKFMSVRGKQIMRTSGGRGHYTETRIPTGKSEDLGFAVSVTAVTAVTGALAIIIASII